MDLDPVLARLADTAGAWPAILASDLLRYLLAAGALTGLLALTSVRWRAARSVRARGPAPGQRRRELAWSMSTVLIFSLVGGVVYTGHQAGWLRVYTDPTEHGIAWLIASVVVLVVLHDTWFYWTHRALHHPRLFAWTHRVHHRSVAPTPWAAYAFSPVEALVQAAFLPLVLLAVPTHVAVIFVFTLHMVVRNVVGHCGVELIPRPWLAGAWGRWLTTTLHHDLHHAHGRGNYALYFTAWDRWMGTERPEYRDRLAALVRQAAGVATLVVSTAFALDPGLAWAGPTDPAGPWLTQGASARVEIRPCLKARDTLCGTIAWLWDPNDADGQPMRDSRHPDAARRARPLVGLDLLEGFRAAGQPGVFSGGRIYNPEDGRTYAATLTMRPDGTLQVEGCVLFICARQVWRRPNSVCGT